MSNVYFDSMTCGYCGGMVQWVGAWDNISGTKCTRCGAVNPPLANKDDKNILDENFELGD